MWSLCDEIVFYFISGMVGRSGLMCAGYVTSSVERGGEAGNVWCGSEILTLPYPSQQHPWKDAKSPPQEQGCEGSPRRHLPDESPGHGGVVG